MKRLLRAIALVGLALGAACTAASSADDSTLPHDQPGLTLEAAGATFPYPVYTRWFSSYAAQGGARINYRSIGSGAGIRALIDGTADFAATDIPLDDADRAQLASRGIRQVPLVVGGVAVTYNLPGVARQLRLDGATLGDIYLGRITRWNDPILVALNPDIVLPDAPLHVITRADTSGTSWILTEYLSHLSPGWARGPGRSRFPAWPVGARVRGNEGVAAEIKATEFAVGAVEAVYAMQNRLQVARIRNHAGAWVTPQTGGLRAAASAMLASIDDTLEFATSISDAPGEASYPIAALSWLLVPSRGRDTMQVRAMGGFVRWALSHGQDDALTLGYAPLPDAMRQALLRTWTAPRP